MPKLKFLDAKMIEKSEWSIIHSDAASIEEKVSMQSEVVEKRGGFWARIFGRGGGDKETTNQQSTYSPLPEDSNRDEVDTPRTSYGKLRHFYKGTESQGNRFIGNTML